MQGTLSFNTVANSTRNMITCPHYPCSNNSGMTMTFLLGHQTQTGTTNNDDKLYFIYLDSFLHHYTLRTH